MDDDFEWDDANRLHIARHDVTPDDCEQAMNAAFETEEVSSDGERRWKTIGVNWRGEILEVIWTLRGERYRVVTAWKQQRKRK